MSTFYNKPADVDIAKHTPLLRLSSYMKMYELQTDLLAKVDAFNPSNKDSFSKRVIIPNFDRVVAPIIEYAEKEGLINKKHTVLIEPCFKSGVGLAWIIQRKGYKLILTVPDTMSKKHISLIKTLDAIVVLTPGEKGLEGAIEKAKQLRDEIPGAVILEQFSDKVPEIQKTGDIWEYACGNADILVVSADTEMNFQIQVNNFLSFLKKKNPAIKMVAVKSEASTDNNSVSGNHEYITDETIVIKNDDAAETVEEVAITEGMIVGMLSGAVINAATIISQREENFGKTILVVLPDTTDRYISTTLL
ncbi:MAG: pyridoxal-phosphate dependent enzyme [Prevotellaceae bacterium]|jgi:cysteine synthase A|nr:pyridoxal-phosphate dependent enzyme [Prevotellaceae bacterium]